MKKGCLLAAFLFLRKIIRTKFFRYVVAHKFIFNFWNNLRYSTLLFLQIFE